MATKQKIWLIIDLSTGFSKALATSVIESGEFLIATARKTEKLQELVDTVPDHEMTLIG